MIEVKKVVRYEIEGQSFGSEAEARQWLWEEEVRKALKIKGWLYVGCDRTTGFEMKGILELYETLQRIYIKVYGVC